MTKEFAREDVERSLDAILADARFTAAKRMSAFLDYVVRQTLDGHSERIKAYTVGIEALEKPETFDPQTDPSVRVLAKRLRSSLIDYHERNPQASPVIEIRCGSYCPVFREPTLPVVARPEAGERAPSGLYRSSTSHPSSPCVHVLATQQPGTLGAQLVAVLCGTLARRPGIRVIRRDTGASPREATVRQDYELSLDVLPLEHEQRVELQLLRASDGQVLEGMSVRMSDDDRRQVAGTVTRAELVVEIEHFAAGVARTDGVLFSDYRATVTPITSIGDQRSAKSSLCMG